MSGAWIILRQLLHWKVPAQWLTAAKSFVEWVPSFSPCPQPSQGSVQLGQDYWQLRERAGGNMWQNLWWGPNDPPTPFLLQEHQQALLVKVFLGSPSCSSLDNNGHAVPRNTSPQLGVLSLKLLLEVIWILWYKLLVGRGWEDLHLSLLNWSLQNPRLECKYC